MPFEVILAVTPAQYFACIEHGGPVEIVAPLRAFIAATKLPSARFFFVIPGVHDIAIKTDSLY